MEHFDTRKHSGTFDVLTQTRSGQAAMMTLNPGEASDEDFTNEHPRSEQWVFVIEGSATAHIGKTEQARKKLTLRPGMLLLINKGELHQLQNTGTTPLKLLNWYAPPAYTKKGDPRPSASR
jgi:mannose-6-phosphate isomerase-like protein (cupin superfamily)